MKNIEKYKEEIKAKVKNGTSLECSIHDIRDVCSCGEPFRCTDCQLKSLDWILQEYKEPILDDIERKYLSAVIKPFKNRVKSINKVVCRNDLAFIRLTFDENDHVYFPYFRLKSGMYKGMENNKDYTLEELGL